MTAALKTAGKGLAPSIRQQFGPGLVVIGASAGGPAALAEILGRLQVGYPAPIVIIQHVDGQFAAGMASWLNQGSPLCVRLAEEGDALVPGQVLLAGREAHLVLKSSSRLGYVSEPADAFYRPSVDVFFDSVATYWPGRVMAILLTGMGADGAKGLKGLRLKGHYTIAQDEASSAVYGMPKAAAAANAATEILSLERIVGVVAAGFAGGEVGK